MFTGKAPLLHIVHPFGFFILFLSSSLHPLGITLHLCLLSQTAKLTVNVLDVNDNTPRFRPFGATYFTERILEGATPGTTLISVSAVDPDKGPNGQITYELLNLSPEGYARLEDPSAGRQETCKSLFSCLCS